MFEPENWVGGGILSSLVSRWQPFLSSSFAKQFFHWERMLTFGGVCLRYCLYIWFPPIRKNRIKTSVLITFFLTVYSRTHSAVLQTSCHNKNILLWGQLAPSCQNRFLLTTPSSGCWEITGWKQEACFLEQCSGAWPDEACSFQPWQWITGGCRGPFKSYLGWQVLFVGVLDAVLEEVSSFMLQRVSGSWKTGCVWTSFGGSYS